MVRASHAQSGDGGVMSEFRRCSGCGRSIPWDCVDEPWATENGVCVVCKKGTFDQSPLHPETDTAAAERRLSDGQAKIPDCCVQSSAPHLKAVRDASLGYRSACQRLAALKWNSIDFDKGMINLRDPDETRPMKGRAVVPMNDTARAALLVAQRARTSEYVIEYHGEPVASRQEGAQAGGARSGGRMSAAHV
jgi:integrase